jgi:uncharacterized protein (DUF4415 family)
MNELTKSQQQEIDALALMSDANIDKNDQPELTEQQLIKVQIGRFYKPIKQPVTMRLDADVVAWFKGRYGKYQTQMNHILRKHMEDNS